MIFSSSNNLPSFSSSFLPSLFLSFLLSLSLSLFASLELSFGSPILLSLPSASLRAGVHTVRHCLRRPTAASTSAAECFPSPNAPPALETSTRAVERLRAHLLVHHLPGLFVDLVIVPKRVWSQRPADSSFQPQGRPMRGIRFVWVRDGLGVGLLVVVAC